MTAEPTIDAWLTDMDGALVREGEAIPGAAGFIDRLVRTDRPFPVLTDDSIPTPRDLSARLAHAGLTVPESRIETHSEGTAMIDDRMETDVVAGIEAGLETFLVLTGSTRRSEIERFPHRPRHVVDSIADLVDRV